MFYVNFSVKFAPKWSLSCYQPISAAIFVTIATIKVQLIPDIYIWAIDLINQYEEIGEKQFFSGGKNSPPMHVAARSSLSCS